MLKALRPYEWVTKLGAPFGTGGASPKKNVREPNANQYVPACFRPDDVRFLPSADSVFSSRKFSKKKFFFLSKTVIFRSKKLLLFRSGRSREKIWGRKIRESSRNFTTPSRRSRRDCEKNFPRFLPPRACFEKGKIFFSRISRSFSPVSLPRD